MMKHKAPFYMGGGTETELTKFDLQRFAEVENPYETILNSNIITSGSIQPPLVSLQLYCMSNVDGHSNITELPQENIEYLSSGLVVSNCENAFMALFKLISLPYNEFNIDTRYCTNMKNMFRNCPSLSSLNISGMSTISCTDMSYMFAYCTDLQEIICPDGFDLSSCSNIAYMFDGCISYSGEPLHFKNVPRNLSFSMISGTEGKHYVIDSYLD